MTIFRKRSVVRLKVFLFGYQFFKYIFNFYILYLQCFCKSN